MDATEACGAIMDAESDGHAEQRRNKNPIPKYMTGAVMTLLFEPRSGSTSTPSDLETERANERRRRSFVVTRHCLFWCGAVRALGDLWRTYAKKGIKMAYVFVNECGQPFGRMGIARMIERAGEAAKLPFPVHVHMLRHSTGYDRSLLGVDR